METKARVIAFYLPQFHPVDINDKYWGKGFTEWTNVAKAKPLYPGHYQPQIPADLGFYDLRLPQVREAQAEMAREAGVEGFCYWYYWFGKGKKVLEMPINEVLKTKKPDYPFCIGWANHDWSNKTWQKSSNFKKEIVFLKQEYLGKEDYTSFFYDVLPFFEDSRYIHIDNKPVLYIYDPESIPDQELFIDLWNELAIKNGLEGVYIIARANAISHIKIGKKKELLSETADLYEKLMSKGYNALNPDAFKRAELISRGALLKAKRIVQRKFTGYALHRYDYKKLMDNYYMPEDRLEYIYPQIMPRKDKTPRAGRNALVYSGSTPELFRKYVRVALDCIKDKEYEHKVLFLNSWNEWGEGSYMEPDIRYGHQYLDVLQEEIFVK